MRNVDRPSKPRVLSEHADTWTRELLRELAKASPNKKRLKSLQRKYAHPNVKNTLKKMYKYCCYCESRVNSVAIEHIEHRKPQSKFPEQTFTWENLHLACPTCNKYKSDRWDEGHEILDAETNVPISDFLSYRRYFRHPETLRGKTTVDHAELNRIELVDAREELYPTIMYIIEEYNNDPRAPGSDIAHRKLKELSKGQFGSYVEYLTKTYMRRSDEN